MQQTFEYYVVNPDTWKDESKLENVKSCSISRDSDTETMGSATIEAVDLVGECYVRIYLITIQNGITEKFPLGTYLVQTPTSSFNGTARDVSMDAYTPLLELKESPPPLGYSVPKGENVMSIAYNLTSENMRAPVVPTTSSETLSYDFVSTTDDTWLSFISDLIANVKYTLALDEMGRVLFEPKQNMASLQPVYTFNDDETSIMYPEVTMNHDLYGIPNVVEVIYSNGDDTYYARVVNDDENSPVSTIARGREIIYRETNPNLAGFSTQEQITEYAEQLLSELSSVEYSVTFTHGYCGVRVNDCVRINNARAQLDGVKAKIISQTIKCTPGCPVTARAVYTTKLWR